MLPILRARPSAARTMSAAFACRPQARPKGPTAILAAHHDLGKHRGPEDTKEHRGKASVILCASEFFSGRDARHKSVVHFHET